MEQNQQDSIEIKVSKTVKKPVLHLEMNIITKKFTVYISQECPKCDGYGCHGGGCETKFISICNSFNDLFNKLDGDVADEIRTVLENSLAESY
jgi:hypothetical protein